MESRDPLQQYETLAVLGAGPAGLMAAWRASQAGLKVRVFEKRKAPGRKLLVAGSSGLNITYDCPLDEFVRHYSCSTESERFGLRRRFENFFADFSPDAWRTFIESELGISTFKGTSRRWFVESEGMKASGLLKAWVAKLEARGVVFELGRECVGFESLVATRAVTGGVELRFADGSTDRFDAACFCLGGGSWEPSEKPLRWPKFFQDKGLIFRDFEASNVGFQVAWPDALLKEAEGKPIKNVVMRTSRGERSGDLVITKYGLEGTPIYFAGESGRVSLDLKPDLTLEQVTTKLRFVKENLAPLRRARRVLNLGDGALALLFHTANQHIPLPQQANLEAWAALIKDYPLTLGAKQSIDEAISSSGGIGWEEIDNQMMLKRFPGIYVAGEMIDWDAPTGGFLIQACVSQGHFAGAAIAARAAKRE